MQCLQDNVTCIFKFMLTSTFKRWKVSIQNQINYIPAEKYWEVSAQATWIFKRSWVSLCLPAYPSVWSNVCWYNLEIHTRLGKFLSQFSFRPLSQLIPVVSVFFSNACVLHSLSLMIPLKLGIFQPFNKYFSVSSGPGLVLGPRNQGGKNTLWWLRESLELSWLVLNPSVVIIWVIWGSF